MSEQDPWLSSALEELHEFEQAYQEGGLDPLSAYRVLVLCARVEQARAAGLDISLPESLRDLATHVEEIAEPSDPHLLIGRIHSLLPSDDEAMIDDPFGELLDTLLDVDDLATLEDSRRRSEQARRLVEQANARVAMSADRVAELGGMAERRLALLPKSASVRKLWDTIAQAAEEAAEDALPPTEPTSLAQRRLPEKIQGAGQPSVWEDLSESSQVARTFQLAAADLSTAEEETEHGRVSTYVSEEEVYVWVDFPPGKQAAGDLELHLSVGERSARWTFPLRRTSRRGALASLGKRDALRERFRTEGFTAIPGGLRLLVHLPLKDVTDEPQ